MARITRLFLIVAIALALLMWLDLALTRGFDPDEFAHLHWAWLVARGYLPYRDFFLYIAPVFPLALTPILALTGESTSFLLGSRLFIVLMHGILALLIYTFTKRYSSRQHGLLAVLIFLTFPMTLDKTIDIRPDLVMLVLYFTSAWLLFQPEKARPHLIGGQAFQAKLMISGVLFGISFLVLPKIVVGLPALLYLLVSPPQPNKMKQFQTVIIWTFGAAIAGLLFFLYLQANGITQLAYQALTKDSLAVTHGKYGFSPLLLLTPYPLIYLSSNTPSIPWIVNTMVWIASIIGFIRLIRVAHAKLKAVSIFVTLFTVGNIAFIILFPAPYVQYFLPLSVVASVLAGSSLSVIFAGMTRLGGPALSMLLPLLLLTSFFLQYKERVAPNADNKEQLQVIRDVLAVTKPGETIYDMVGSFVFRPDGFFICCHPYGEFIHRLASRPGLERGFRESLILRQTKFLVMDQVGFVFWQTPEPDLAFLRANYLPTKYNKLYSLGVQFRCQKGACLQYTLNNQPAANRSTTTFTILVPETYTITLEPNTTTVTIDGKEIQNGQTLDLAAGLHRFAAPLSLTDFRIQLAR